MFLTGLLGASGRSSSTSSKSRSSRNQGATPEASPVRRPKSPDPASTTYISDESQLQPAQPLALETLDLNKSLEVLAAVFPDVQVEVFREMLSSFSEESRLAVVADAMLKNPSAYVKGRRRLRNAQKDAQGPAADTLVPITETFRGNAYRDAVRCLALQEFKGLSRSSIEAVLSESNYSYLDARPTLVDLSTKSWKFTIQSLFFRRKPVTTGEAENHPLVVWKSSGQGSIIPMIKSTGHAELDRELFEELIMPLKRQETATREETDRTLAVSLNNEEAEACDATFECACCYSDVTFEEMTTCHTEGHMVCFRCVQHSITEAVFGQGWIRSINKDSGTLRCPAVATIECQGCVPTEHIYRAMQAQKNGAEILHKMDQRLAEHDLIASDLPLIRCPFCSYAEVDDLYVPTTQSRLRLRASNIPNLVLLVLCSFVLPLSIPLLLVACACLVLSCSGAFRSYLTGQFRAAVSRYQRRRMGLKFTCRNPACGQASCLSCSKAWVDIHVCHESSLVALRTQVEQAMSLAIKRVCPRCSTSFVKTAGCNKLTCPCGYKMCYVCRRDIGAASEGYAHFCEHFRPEGDGRRCRDCTKCNLWQAEDTDALLRAAKADAEARWRETERRELSGPERAYLETGVASKRDDVVTRLVNHGVRMPSISDICDSIVETLFIIGS
ncbi:hypothetical protein JX265_003187 [Neoarthrinium moseri]|uniref:RING-type domain-containing protein n=1 Tax=Neoarthrinium moseri TaxID=1658444 RepID=A0A9Q0AUB9_9PEZI|nr:hypothetical protein JX266_002239 [Neoarthrinium moseri]KAI1879010.1 hypothetical protein JX265_003187 [Neoarthrinium moseri]